MSFTKLVNYSYSSEKVPADVRVDALSPQPPVHISAPDTELTIKTIIMILWEKKHLKLHRTFKSFRIFHIQKIQTESKNTTLGG